MIWYLIGGTLAFVLVLTMLIRVENAKTKRYIAALHEMGRRCPDCGGVGWHFGPPGTGDPDISTPTCQTCKGTGELP